MSTKHSLTGRLGQVLPAVLLASGLILSGVIDDGGTARAHDKRDPLRIDVPSRPRLDNTTRPVLYKCSGMEDCQAQAASFCKGFNYPNGKILFRTLPERPKPFPIYSVICFE